MLYSFVNFADVVSTASLSLRIMTGEDWHHILRDTMVSGRGMWSTWRCGVGWVECGVEMEGGDGEWKVEMEKWGWRGSIVKGFVESRRMGVEN